MSAVAIRNLAFDNLLIRVVDRAGDPWFVASDVCAAIDIQNPSASVKVLDEDERSKFNLGRQGDGIIISESGLYTLMMRARSAWTPDTVAWRFRRWVTRDVLPTLRRTGRYEIVPTEEEAVLESDEHEDDMMMKLAFVREARRTFGRAAAARAWRAIGLPPVATASEGAVVDHGEARWPQVVEWLRERTLPAPGHWIETSVLYRDFLAWCQASGQQPTNIVNFGLDLKRMGHEPWKCGTTRRRGLRLVDAVPGAVSLQ